MRLGLRSFCVLRSSRSSSETQPPSATGGLHRPAHFPVECLPCPTLQRWEFSRIDHLRLLTAAPVTGKTIAMPETMKINRGTHKKGARICPATMADAMRQTPIFQNRPIGRARTGRTPAGGGKYLHIANGYSNPAASASQNDREPGMRDNVLRC
jgi:hypothetical protein